MKLTKQTLRKLIRQTIKEQLDPVGKSEDGKVPVGTIRDIDNDGDIDDSDSYLALRRKKITQSMNEQTDEGRDYEFQDLEMTPDGKVEGYVSINGRYLEAGEMQRLHGHLTSLIGIENVLISDKQRLQDASSIEFEINVVYLLDEILSSAGYTVNS